MARKRVVVTGLGMLSPVGSNVTSSWKKIIEGSSGVKEIDKFDTSKSSLNNDLMPSGKKFVLKADGYSNNKRYRVRA